ncbi:hypothetical protein F5B19DRAFT_448617 [Rostrohypoxylon terebratum]|nr:hypothetical protein F5B19DRAFT_448617 [Rostrohypoxylon terebratum]
MRRYGRNNYIHTYLGTHYPKQKQPRTPSLKLARLTCYNSLPTVVESLLQLRSVPKMASLPTIVLSVLVFVKQCRAQQEDADRPVPANFPKAFITAIAVATICVITVLALVCVLAHCWQQLLRYRGGGMRSSVRAPERWVDRVFERPQQLMPRSRDDRKKENHWQHRPVPMDKRITLGARGQRRENREDMFRDWTQDEGVGSTPLRNIDSKGLVTCYLPEPAGIKTHAEI